MPPWLTDRKGRVSESIILVTIYKIGIPQSYRSIHLRLNKNVVWLSMLFFFINLEVSYCSISTIINSKRRCN